MAKARKAGSDGDAKVEERPKRAATPATRTATEELVVDLAAPRLRHFLDILNIDGDRRSKAAMQGLLASAPFLTIAGGMSLLELQSVCERLGLKTGGTKAEIAARIADAKKTAAAPKAKAHGAAEAVEGGALKAALRRFAVEVPNLRGRDAAQKLVTSLLACFGWPDGRPQGTQMPATVRVVEHGVQTTRDVSLLWPDRRFLLDVVDPDTNLDAAWKDLLRTCLQVDPIPQYVVLTNRRDVRLYDLASDRETARLTLSMDDLPKHSEAFPFLSPAWVPGSTPKIINQDKVSREVAELVARLYRSLKSKHPKREDEVIQFTLQCIITMFAEDIGLIPKGYFTTLLYEGAQHRDVESRLRELFRLMSTKDVPAPRTIAFFNGGLFKQPVTLPLGDEQLAALTRASESNWTYVDPHIFGSVFQGIMNDEERHATGAHYTAHDDIMRVVSPTIIEPWRKRIGEAETLEKLLALRGELFKYRVLDPACGSGNFLYVAFRELYRLDTELLVRIRKFTSVTNVAWNVGIPTSNFFGIDLNPFAVELAKVTLNIAKKIAFDERRHGIAAVEGQLGFDVDPSLPLDNLNENIVCADALFTEWPTVDAIVGNPPFLGGLKIREELGEDYLHQLQGRFADVSGRADFCAYWFIRAHDHLRSDGRAGFVATNSIRDGNTRDASTGYLTAHGGTIVSAVSSQDWPGDAVVKVSMVNWVKGSASGPFQLVVDGHLYELPHIAPHLQLHVDIGSAEPIAANGDGTSQGIVLGTKLFELDVDAARQVSAERASRPFVKAVADGTRLFAGRLGSNPNWVIDMSACADEKAASRAEKAYKHLRANVLPYVRSKGDTYAGWEARWWQPWRPRAEFFRALTGTRIIACSRHAARNVFVFLSRASFLPTESLQLFAFDDDYSFGVLQSTHHWTWAVHKGTKIKEDTRYTVEVWSTFPWPQQPPVEAVVEVAAAARELRAVRERLMTENGWSLRALHQAAEVEGFHPLKDAQGKLDDAVGRAYGLVTGQDATEFFLELNRCLIEDEKQGRSVTGPGLPSGFASTDPRWSSSDCIEAPPLT